MENCTIELGCIFLPVDPSQQDLEVAKERKMEWERARAVCEALGIQCSFEMNRDHGDIVGDAYVYTPLESVEAVLRALDNADVSYDNIDLPAATPAKTVARLRSIYPPGQEVWVNVQGRG